MLPSANLTIPQDQRWLPAGPRKMQQDKVHLQKALAVTTEHILTLMSQKGGEKDYLKKPKEKLLCPKSGKATAHKYSQGSKGPAAL